MLLLSCKIKYSGYTFFVRYTFAYFFQTYFMLLTELFEEKFDFLILFNLAIFSFWLILLVSWVMLAYHRWKWFCPVFPIWNFIVLAFKFRLIICFEFIMCMVWCKINVYFFTWRPPVVPALFVGKSFFSYWLDFIASSTATDIIMWVHFQPLYSLPLISIDVSGFP